MSEKNIYKYSTERLFKELEAERAKVKEYQLLIQAWKGIDQRLKMAVKAFEKIQCESFDPPKKGWMSREEMVMIADEALAKIKEGRE